MLLVSCASANQFDLIHFALSYKWMLKNQSKILPLICSNNNDDVTDFEVCRFSKNRKYKCLEKNIFSLKKIII